MLRVGDLEEIVLLSNNIHCLCGPNHIRNMAGISPISNAEFLQMIQRCLPHKGWSSKFAVAHSGGADSTCLIFLLRRLSWEFQKENGPKISFCSYHVNHDLQPASVDMARSCAEMAGSFGVSHRELRIPWGTPPFPPRPAPGDALEGIARRARYHILFHEMVTARVDALMFGHHADDQVETALMRLMKGTKEFGLAGMRPIRRWGMGFGRDRESLGWAGYRGMRRHIMRPLLDVSKDRILATCAANNLCFVQDPSNFQPELTVRNAIRQVLDPAPQLPALSAPPSEVVPSGAIAVATKAVEDLRKKSESLLPFCGSSRDQLRDAVRMYKNRLDLAESTATSTLRNIGSTFPPSTFLLEEKKNAVPDDDSVRTAMVLRILRYVSPEPWGSLAAQCHRRSSSLLNIVNRIWDTETPFEQRRAFTAGAQVQWTPVRICRNGMLKYGTPLEDDRVGWLASRSPVDALRVSSVNVDVTQALQRKLQHMKLGQTRGSELRVMYDNRFLLSFNLGGMHPQMVDALRAGEGRVRIVPETRWVWPKVVWESVDEPDVEVKQAGVVAGEMRWRSSDMSRRHSRWIDIKFIRILDD